MKSVDEFEKFSGRKFSAAEILHVKVIPLQAEGKTRLVYGPLSTLIDLDFTQKSLSDLSEQLALALRHYERLVPNAFAGKKVRVYQGGNHLDIINDGVGSMGWLAVEDHLT